MTFPPAPSLPPLDEQGWERIDEREEVQLELPTMRVLAHTLVYEDGSLRTRVKEATDIDHTWRFFFATRLGFEPPLPPLTGTASVYGSVRSGARESFVDDLRDRGVEGLEQGRTERTRTETGDRVSLTRYRGRYRLDVDGESTTVPVAGLLGVWTHDGTFRLAGGWYPDQSLSVTLADGPETDPNAFRNELIDLVRGTR
jgi:hypothetical protein